MQRFARARFGVAARARQRDGNRQITIRRFGWSDVSQDEAQAMADARTSEALQRAIRGEVLIRRERATATAESASRFVKRFSTGSATR